MIAKPFSQACENNKNAILNVIREVFCQPVTVWEIGSGTGQHACHFASQLPHIKWQPTDRSENIPGIQFWRQEAQLPNLMPPLALDVTDPVWPCTSIEALFTANTLHIMSWQNIEIFFARLSLYLNSNALLCIYGPFNYQGKYTSDSNARFDGWLKSRDPLSGIRDFEAVKDLAAGHGIELLDDVAMPANNRVLILKRQNAVR